MASTSISSLLERIAAVGKAYENGEDGARETLLDLGHLLVSGLEIPSEFLQRTFWSEPSKSATLRLAVDRQIFQHLRDAGAQGITPAELAQKTGVEESLLTRLLRHLVATHLLVFRDGRFRATSMASSLSEDKWQRSISFCYDCPRVSFAGFPEYFRARGYRLPEPPAPGVSTTVETRSPFQAAHGTDLPFFDWLGATPPRLQEFDTFMAAYRAGHKNWFDDGFYPVAERLVAGFDATIGDGLLLVDVGGGRGHDLRGFAARHAASIRDGGAKLLLQDRPQVLASIPAGGERPFEVMAHDVFTTQPVAHARAYFMHSVAHVFNDEENGAALRNLRPALRPGYSRLLIHDIVVSEEEPRLAATSMDTIMMASHPRGVHERTEAEFRAMLAGAGYRVVRIWSHPGAAESLIEAEVDA